MLYVPDANVAIKWFFNEEFSDQARRLMARLLDGSDQATAPDLLRLEFGHVLRKRAVQRGIPTATAREMWNDFNAVPIVWRPTQPLADPGLDLALTTMVSFYDAIYVKVAEENGTIIVSADAGVIANAARIGKGLHIRDYPKDAREQPPSEDA